MTILVYHDSNVIHVTQRIGIYFSNYCEQWLILYILV